MPDWINSIIAHIPDRWRYRSIFIINFFLSIGAIGLACVYHAPADAGKGGAVAVALSLIVLFLGRNESRRLLETLIGSGKKLRVILPVAVVKPLHPNDAAEMDRQFVLLQGQVRQLQTDFSALFDDLSQTHEDNRLQNKWMALSAGIGTLAWGFGDWIVYWIL